MDHHQHVELEAAGLRTFFRIADIWRLSEAERAAILNLDEEGLRLAKEQPASIKQETLHRLSYVFRIYRAVNTLLPDAHRAAEWMRAPGKVPIHGGRSAITIMASGEPNDLQRVTEYLDAECQ
ncbi:DUF2384 domain-containing protein [Sphingomonas kaistensis]|uniref:DUF2384 domain-containing protein n=1 Tax=Sphingomonas kaistensis TaxID=298708 RepID=A0ABZ2G3S0_9SPHN